MTQPGEVKRPPGGEPGVSVAWRSAAVREIAGPAADKLAADGLPSALAAKDPGLWGPGAAGEAAIRLGWLDAPRASRALLGSLAVLASDVREQGFDHVVLCGMGGSSLAPEVISRAAKVPLTLLDTTDPHPVRRALADRLDRTVVVISSKSGSTIETDSHRRVYERAFADLGLAPGEIARRCVMVTDPGSPLEASARQAGYHVVLADPNVGGRYSALTAFGLVPTALAGADVARLLDEADAVLTALACATATPAWSWAPRSVGTRWPVMTRWCSRTAGPGCPALVTGRNSSSPSPPASRAGASCLWWWAGRTPPASLQARICTWSAWARLPRPRTRR